MDCFQADKLFHGQTAVRRKAPDDEKEENRARSTRMRWRHAGCLELFQQKWCREKKERTHHYCVLITFVVNYLSRRVNI